MIGRRRLFIRSAAVHYYRLTRGEWTELLDKVLLAGCNTVETYIPWNWHEEAPGQSSMSWASPQAVRLTVLLADGKLH